MLRQELAKKDDHVKNLSECLRLNKSEDGQGSESDGDENELNDDLSDDSRGDIDCRERSEDSEDDLNRDENIEDEDLQ